MTRIQAGSNSAILAVASIPPRIWAQDQDVWKAWYQSKIKANRATMQQYKRYIAEFYIEVNKPIGDVTEQDIANYVAPIAHVRTIRAYWTFAKEQKRPALAHFFVHLAESLHLLEDELELDLGTIFTIEITPHISGHGWWMDINEGMGDGMYVWIERGRLGTLEVNLNGYYADWVYPPATNA